MSTLDEVVAVADAGLHRWVHERVAESARRSALREELTWAVEVATVDREFAEAFASAQPQSGQPAEAYLNRWVQVTRDLHLLVGPRYRGRDPDRPFVAVEATTRVLRESDLSSVTLALEPVFAAFRPAGVVFWSSRPAGGWPGCGADNRDVVGLLGELAGRPRPDELSFRVAGDLACYPRYEQIHEEHVAAEPEHAVHTRLETREQMAALVEQGLVHDVQVDGRWAGVVAASPAVLRGLRGFEVVELLLDPAVRGLGYGRHLSSALSAELVGRPGTTDADRFLLGTIHVDNLRAYRAAIAAGRRDVGGEVVVPLR